MGYSWGIHGVYICIGYVSGMYRVCIGNVLKDSMSEKGSYSNFVQGKYRLSEHDRMKT